MTPKHGFVWGAGLMVLTLMCVWAIDGPTALRMTGVGSGMHQMAESLTRGVELVFGFGLSKFATGAAIVAVALTLFAFATARPTAWGLLFVGVSQLTARLVAGILKNVFARPRPFEAIVEGGWHDRFFADSGSSFPSGHASHFWGLFFAIAMAFPKLRFPALILAIAVSAARVTVNDHYVSDVLGSAAISAFVAVSWAPLLLKGRAGHELRALKAVAQPHQTKHEE